ncbi:MAG: type II toxin-antitoxin system mRNA interferase toxin, RelE/StbE family [Nitrospirae bacterium]|nr:type II toxin-antitoxin system mRNA interferase toxin, RelE/StbE family [Nitrospirota bacterium]
MLIRTTPSFLRQAKKIFKKTPHLKENLKIIVEKLTCNPFEPALKTHRLTGDLKEFWSCDVSYEIRLRFKIVGDIVELIDIGTHDDVY